MNIGANKDSADRVADYVAGVRALGPNDRAMLEGLNVEKLIPDARERLAKRKTKKT